MTSPRPASRRRQRSTRLVVASLFIAVAALFVAGTAVTGAWVAVLLGAGLAVLLGAVAVRITWAEVVESRRDAARDRAQQALGYLALTEVRTAEQAIYVADVRGRTARLEATIGRLELRLADAALDVAETHRTLEAEREAARTVVVERDRAVARLDEAEDRAAQAIVQVAELEQELDIVLAEWRAGTAAPKRKHA